MKKILLSSVALFGLTAGALAADLPRRVVAPAPYIPVPVFTWTGFYVGVNAGYGFSDRNHDDVCGSGSFGFGFGDCFGGSGLSVATVNGRAPVVPLTGNTFASARASTTATTATASSAAARSATTTSSRQAPAG
jgi:opacity protein-like surface antigen